MHRLRIMAACCAIVSTIPSGAFAAVTVTTVDSTGDVGFLTDLTIGPDGFPIIAHYDENQSYLVIVDCGNAACSSGNTITDAETSGNAMQTDFSIALGADNLPVISYYQYPYPTVLHCGNTACSSGNTIENIDNGPGGEGEETDIAIAADGFPFFTVGEAFFNNYSISFVDCSNATCTSRSTSFVLWKEEADLQAFGLDTAAGFIGSTWR